MSHQVKVDDPFTGLYGFHPIATTVSDDDSDDHSVSSSIYVDSIGDEECKSFQNENAWNPVTLKEVASSMFVEVDHEQRFDLIRSNDSIVLDHSLPSTATAGKEVEGAEASAPNRGRRRRFTEKKKNKQDQQGRLLQASFKPCVWDVVRGEEEEWREREQQQNNVCPLLAMSSYSHFRYSPCSSCPSDFTKQEEGSIRPYRQSSHEIASGKQFETIPRKSLSTEKVSIDSIDR